MILRASLFFFREAFSKQSSIFFTNPIFFHEKFFFLQCDSLASEFNGNVLLLYL